jgi:hypothetical protein
MRGDKETSKWKPDGSGNPTGASRRCVQVEEAFQRAFSNARSKEACAIQRFAPHTQWLQLLNEVHDAKFDYSKLSDEQLQQLDVILEKARAQPLSLERGERATTPA